MMSHGQYPNVSGPLDDKVELLDMGRVALSGTDHSLMLEEAESKRKEQFEGLLMAPGLLQHNDDLGGCPVKPASLVATSNIVMVGATSEFPEMEVSPLRKLSKQWTSSRGLYLALQEEKLQKQHYDCAEKLEALATRLEVVQSLQGSTLCRALHSPASAVETLQQLEVNLRSVYGHLNKVLNAILARRSPAPHMPAQTIPPGACSSEEEASEYLADVQRCVQVIAPHLARRAALLAQRLQQISAPDADSMVGMPSSAEASSGAGSGSDVTGTFLCRSTGEGQIEGLRQAAVDLDAKITFLLDCHAPEAKEVQVQPSETLQRMPSVQPHPDALARPSLFRILAKTSLFSATQDNVGLLFTVEKYMQRAFAPKGCSLILEGTVGECMWIVISGACQVTVDGFVQQTHREGDFFGEVALLYACRRMADVRVTEDAELLLLPKAAFLALLDGFPHARHSIEELAAERRRRIQALPRYASPCPEAPCESVFERVRSSSTVLALLDEQTAGEEEGLRHMLLELHQAATRRKVNAWDHVLKAGSRGAGLVVVAEGNCEIYKLYSEKLHACPTGTVFGLGPLLYSGRIGYDVVAGPAGAEVLQVSEEALFAYLEAHPTVLPLLRASVDAKVQNTADDVWQFV